MKSEEVRGSQGQLSSQFRQRGQERAVVGLGEKDRGSVDAPQNGMHRDAGGDKARVSGHTDVLTGKTGERTLPGNRSLSRVSPGFSCPGFLCPRFL